MRRIASRIACWPDDVEDEDHENGDSTNHIAMLLDRLVTDFDDTEPCLSDLQDTMMHPLDPALTTFCKFSELPSELRELVFHFCFQPFVVKMYCAGWDEIRSTLATSGSMLADRVPAANRLAHGLLDLENPSRVIFVDQRPVRTVPLLHVCQLSRKLAISRYGVPDSRKLLFDPKIDTIRLCGSQRPVGKLKLWHIFGIHENIVFDFSRIRTLQLHIAGYSTGARLRLSPDDLFNDHIGLEHASTLHLSFTSLPTRAAVGIFTIDLLQTLDWMDSSMPELESLCFTILLKSGVTVLSGEQEQILADSEDEDASDVDLSNIRSCMVASAEWWKTNQGRMYLPRLRCLSIDMVTEDTAPIQA